MKSGSNIYTTIEADRSLEEVVHFLAQRWSLAVIDTFLDAVDQRLSQLQVTPMMGPAILNTRYRKLFVHKNVSLFYKLEGLDIIVLLFWDNRQDPDLLFEKLRISEYS